MIEAFGNIWEHVNDYDALAITTNGFTKKNGEAVMGRGIALAAAEKYPALKIRLGFMNYVVGNVVHEINGRLPFYIYSFPVKPEFGPGGIPGWRAKADPALIVQSANQLVEAVNKHPDIQKVLMPRPGCGNGGLKWEDVKPLIEPIFDDRFTVMENL